ncbi:hypothetical protein VCHC50A2_1499B, partial [Vibrio cholerae HC-50A2]
STERPLPL